MMYMPTIDMIETGRNIEKLRKRSGLSVRELRDLFGFATTQAIYKWQRGLTLPTVDNLVVLAMIFHCSTDDILVLEERPYNNYQMKIS